MAAIPSIRNRHHVLDIGVLPVKSKSHDTFPPNSACKIALSSADLVNIILKFSQLDTEDHMETIRVFRSATTA
jgi:hypothetical protein